MIKDPLINLLVSSFNSIGFNVNPNILYILLYNFVPATIFGPLLILKGLKYNDMIIIILGFLLIFVDTIHFFNNSKIILKGDTVI